MASEQPNLSLFSAIFNKDTAAVQQISQQCPEIWLELPFRSYSPLALAISLNALEIIKILLKAGASPQNSISSAISHGNRGIIAEILVALRNDRVLKRQVALQGLVNIAKDFSFDLFWRFSSGVPFVSGVCPSDTYSVSKKGNKWRIDGTLIGFEMGWIRGDVSVISDGDQVWLVDRDQKKVQLVHDSNLGHKSNYRPEMCTSLDMPGCEGKKCEGLCEDVNVAMNTPNTFISNICQIEIARAQKGFFPFKYDKTEIIEEFPTSVWDIKSLKVQFETRTEHLSASPLPTYIIRNKKIEAKRVAIKQKASQPVSKFAITNPEDSSDSDTDATYALEELAIQKQINDYKDGYRNISDLRSDAVDDENSESKKAERDFKAFRASLDPPGICKELLNGRGDLDFGRRKESEFSEHNLNATLWMYEPQGHETDLPVIPIDLKMILPLIDMIGLPSSHLKSLTSILKNDMPPGFPVQLDIPIGVLPLSARIRLGYIEEGCDKDDSFFRVPGTSDGFIKGEIFKE